MITKAIEIIGSQAELARQIGMTRQFMSQIVLGKRPLPAKFAVRIETATGGAVTKEALCPEVFDQDAA